jgi:hypothetical protein
MQMYIVPQIADKNQQVQNIDKYLRNTLIYVTIKKV